MKKTWSRVRLGEVLHHRKGFVTIDDLTMYRRPRVQLHAQGIVLRDEVPGSLIKTKQQQVCRAGDFLVAEIDAKVGGFGIVPVALEGCIVSSHYFLFEIEEAKLDRRFLDCFARTPAFREQVAAQGSTNYAAIRPADVLGYDIPLPPLAEQRRLVARIEKLAAQIQEAQNLREQVAREAEALVASSALRLCSSSRWSTAPVSGLVGTGFLQNGKSVKSSGGGHGVRCLTLSAMRRGLIDVRDSKPVPLTAKEAEPFAVRKGDVFVVRGNGSKALCGQAGLITDDCDRLIFPDLFIRVPLRSERVLPQFFVAAWNSPSTRWDIEEKAKTTSGIWKINQEHIASTRIRIPPLKDQRLIMAELDALRAEVDRLKLLQSETTTEIDALLPAVLDRAFKGHL